MRTLFILQPNRISGNLMLCYYYLQLFTKVSLRKFIPIGYISFCVLLLSSKTVSAQTFQNPNNIWYTTYISKKISRKIRVSNLNINTFDASYHSYNFSVNNIAIQYRLNHKWSISGTYSFGMYSWNKSLLKTYPNTIFVAPQTAIYQGVHIGINYSNKISKRFRLKQSLTAQYYFPSFDKYHIRIIYQPKLSYRLKGKNPHKIKPYVQTGIYYYLNGIPVIFRDANGVITDYASPNGIHRIRSKVGVDFRPFKLYRPLVIGFYYAYNKEFNLSSSKRSLNTPFLLGDRYKVNNAFNNYNIFGLIVKMFI